MLSTLDEIAAAHDTTVAAVSLAWLRQQETVVARVENVVVTLDYNGAGLAGEKTPSADTLNKLAQKAVKEVVAAVAEANDGGSAGTPSSAPSKSASKSPSGSSSKAASSSPSKSAAKKS